MIEAKILKKYGEKVALNVGLSLREGEITAVLGESGAGKTTLLSALAGRIPFEGSVEGVGRTSYLFQNPLLLPNLTAEGNLKFVLPKSEWGKIPEMLRSVGLRGREKSRPRELSGGEKQRVAIARAFLFPHDTLLMDEPFSSLDLALKRSLIDLTLALWTVTRETVVFVTHDVHEAALLAQRAVVIKKGEVFADVTVGETYPRDFFSPQPAEELLMRALIE